VLVEVDQRQENGLLIRFTITKRRRNNMPTVTYAVLNYTISLHRPLAWNLGGQGVVNVASILCTGDSDHRLLVGNHRVKPPVPITTMQEIRLLT
jgi:hypothetical protein